MFVKVDGGWLTPPLDADILPGVMRAAVLADGMRYLGGAVREAVVTRAMVLGAEALALANSLRGVLPAELPAKA